MCAGPVPAGKPPIEIPIFMMTIVGHRRPGVQVPADRGTASTTRNPGRWGTL